VTLPPSDALHKKHRGFILLGGTERSKNVTLSDIRWSCLLPVRSSSLSSIKQRREEFDLHVWNHSEDVFQQGFDFKDNLSPIELTLLEKLIVSLGDSHKRFKETLTSEIVREPYLILPILQVVGLTRSKILTDLKAMGIGVPQKPEGLIAKPEAWNASVSYLETRLSKVLKPLIEMNKESRQIALQSLNQATWPGWIRQERAKRQGHEAEGRIAQLLFNLGLSFEPKEKMTNPMCKDIQIDSVSFDLVSPDVQKVGLCIKSTVQTSNIGQFGESKGALEIIEARKMLVDKFGVDNKVILMAMVDGIGFQTNTAGLHGILENATEFCQFKTLWKVAVVSAHTQGKKVSLNLPDISTHSEFLDTYSNSIVFTNETRVDRMVPAGEALISQVE
jgi:hypothetical protein